MRTIDEILFDYEEIKTKIQKMEKINFPKVFMDNFSGFSGKKNAKEAIHLVFSIDEDFTKKI